MGRNVLQMLEGPLSQRMGQNIISTLDCKEERERERERDRERETERERERESYTLSVLINSDIACYLDTPSFSSIDARFQVMYFSSFQNVNFLHRSAKWTVPVPEPQIR